jgi:2-polyprenyl-6-methoxyphenol hydroxylase-like FAD-dependent oxidoreductase
MSAMRANFTSGNSDPSILIAGAGVGGLVLAIRLKQLGFQPTVLEVRSREAVAHEGEFLNLAPNGMNGLRTVGCFPQVVAAGILTTGMELLNAKGRRLALVDQRDYADRFGAPSITLRRGELAGILADRAEQAGVTLRFDCAVRDVRIAADQVAVTCADGAHHAAPVLVAADGLRSRVRSVVFPEYPAPAYTGLASTGGFAEADVPATDGMMRMTFGDRAFFGYIKAPDRPVYWWDSFPAPEHALGAFTNPVALADHVRALHARDPAPHATILAAVQGLARSYPIFDMPPLPRWSRDRVVLMGDAAHAIGPHAGQGASMAIEDALVLAACLDTEVDHAAAFGHFEELRRPRIAQVVKITARNGARKQSTGRFALWMRDLMLPLVIPLGVRVGRRLLHHRIDLAPLAAA